MCECLLICLSARFLLGVCLVVGLLVRLLVWFHACMLVCLVARSCACERASFGDLCLLVCLFHALFICFVCVIACLFLWLCDCLFGWMLACLFSYSFV